MGYPPRAVTIEQKILAALARIESKLDDTERRVKAISICPQTEQVGRPESGHICGSGYSL